MNQQQKWLSFDSSQPQQMADEFWQWSCHIYQNKEVAGLCLAVQNALGLNVNYLLLALWAQFKGLSIEQELWHTIAQKAQSAEEAVLYIREKRLALKQESEQKYQQALLIELKAEREHQKQSIQAICLENQLVIDRSKANNNLLNYLQYRQISEIDQDTVLQLGQLVQNIGA